jgi:hypothetical protein
VNSEKHTVSRTHGSAAGPLAGTAYDFRKLYPDLAPAAKAPAANASDRSTTRRRLFELFRPGKAQP